MQKAQSHSSQLCIRDIRLEYRYVKASKSTDLTIILLHEGLGCTALGKNIPNEISETLGCDVFAYSRLGYGGSSPVDGDRKIDYMHVEAEQYLPLVVDFINPERYVVLGHSDGGSIATIFVGSDQTLRARKNLQGIILLAPHFFVEDVSIASIQEAGHHYKAGQLRQQLAFYHGKNVDNTFYGWHDAWLLESFRHWQIRPFLAAIEVPVLALQGTNDAYGTALQLDCIQEMQPHKSTIHLMENCGHNVFRDDPEATMDHISKFLNKHNIA